MDLENYERSVKKELETRRIHPSQNAWNKLENMLEAEERTSKKAYWWLAVAASFLLGFIVIQSMNTDDIAIQNNEGTASKPEESPSPHNSNANDPSTSIAAVTTDSTPDTIHSITNIAEKNTRASYQNTNKFTAEIEQKNEKEYKVHFNTNETDSILRSPKESNQPTIESINTEYKVKDLQIAKIEKSVIKDKEIANLLYKAELGLETQIKLKPSNNKINSTQLLNEVEDRILIEEKSDESIHQRVIYFVKDKLKEKVNLVLANR